MRPEERDDLPLGERVVADRRAPPPRCDQVVQQAAAWSADPLGDECPEVVDTGRRDGEGPRRLRRSRVELPLDEAVDIDLDLTGAHGERGRHDGERLREPAHELDRRRSGRQRAAQAPLGGGGQPRHERVDALLAVRKLDERTKVPPGRPVDRPRRGKARVPGLRPVGHIDPADLGPEHVAQMRVVVHHPCAPVLVEVHRRTRVEAGRRQRRRRRRPPGQFPCHSPMSWSPRFRWRRETPAPESAHGYDGATLRQSDRATAAGVNGFCQWINCRHGDTGGAAIYTMYTRRVQSRP